MDDVDCRRSKNLVGDNIQTGICAGSIPGYQQQWTLVILIQVW
jgi:hypothetical protein